MFNQEHQAIVAQLERAWLSETGEPLQIQTAAQEIEALMARSRSVSTTEQQLVFTREDSENPERLKLRYILRRLFQFLGQG